MREICVFFPLTPLVFSCSQWYNTQQADRISFPQEKAMQESELEKHNQMTLFEPRAAEDLKPPYAHYTRFRAFLQEFQETRGYSKDDVLGILGKLNESARYNLRSTLRALRLIDEQYAPTSQLLELSNSGGDRQRIVFQSVLREAYPYLLGSEAEGFDAVNATTEELDERFINAGVTSATTRERCVIFFRNAIKAAGFGQAIPSAAIQHQNGYSGNSLQPTPTYYAANGSQGAERQYPPLPPYEHEWNDDIKRMWFEQRAIEIKKEG
jgi:hypothetical protein